MASVWDMIYTQLEDDGMDVYGPSQKKGDCLSSYVVVKPAGLSRFGNFSTTQNLYNVLCYVPDGKFSDLEPFLETVRASMKKLSPVVKPAYFETEPFFDDTVAAYMVSMQYVNYRKIV